MTQQDKETQPESAETTPTRFVHVREVRFAYRRFGNLAGTPLVLLQHFRGSMDNWDPALVAGGSNDLIIPTVNAFVLAQGLPNAQLILYPDSGHVFLFQYHTLFGQHATLFLES